MSLPSCELLQGFALQTAACECTIVACAAPCPSARPVKGACAWLLWQYAMLTGSPWPSTEPNASLPGCRAKHSYTRLASSFAATKAKPPKP